MTLTLSASIRAPASMTNSCDSSSRTTAAVRPAAVLALPLVYTALGLNSSTCLHRHTHTQINTAVQQMSTAKRALKSVCARRWNKEKLYAKLISEGGNCGTYLRNWLLAVLGSPTMHTLMSPLSEVLSMVVLGTPPKSISRMPRFTSSLPAPSR